MNENEKEQPLWQTDSFEIPYGNFKSFMGHITLERNGLRIWNKGAILSKEITIAYDQLTYLKYVRPQKNIFSDGFLILRWEGNKSKPVPKGYALRNDKTAIHFDYMHHLIFYHLYCVLRTLAPEMIVTEMEIPETLSLNVEAQAKSKYVEDCFNRFSPDRYQATIAYCEHMGINHKTSEMIINRAFDIRQEQIYAASPSTAIRDLNRVLMKDASASYVYG